LKSTDACTDTSYRQNDACTGKRRDESLRGKPETINGAACIDLLRGR
jgi:hypothetical protein